MIQLLAAAGDAASSLDVTALLGPILSTGIVGIVLVMLIFEVGIQTTRSADREREAMGASHEAEKVALDAQIDILKADNAELKNANEKLQTLTQERLIPALVQATEVSRAYVSELARRNDQRP